MKRIVLGVVIALSLFFGITQQGDASNPNAVGMVSGTTSCTIWSYTPYVSGGSYPNKSWAGYSKISCNPGHATVYWCSYIVKDVYLGNDITHASACGYLPAGVGFAQRTIYTGYIKCVGADKMYAETQLVINWAVGRNVQSDRTGSCG